MINTPPSIHYHSKPHTCFNELGISENKKIKVKLRLDQIELNSEVHYLTTLNKVGMNSMK